MTRYTGPCDTPTVNDVAIGDYLIHQGTPGGVVEVTDMYPDPTDHAATLLVFEVGDSESYLPAERVIRAVSGAGARGWRGVSVLFDGYAEPVECDPADLIVLPAGSAPGDTVPDSVGDRITDGYGSAWKG